MLVSYINLAKITSVGYLRIRSISYKSKQHDIIFHKYLFYIIENTTIRFKILKTVSKALVEMINLPSNVSASANVSFPSNRSRHHITARLENFQLTLNVSEVLIRLENPNHG